MLLQKNIFILLLIINTISANERYDLPGGLIDQVQTGDELLCWAYSAYSVLEYYGRELKDYATLSEIRWYGNQNQNKALGVIVGKSSVNGEHTYQEILCNLGGLYTAGINGLTEHSIILGEIKNKNPVIFVFAYSGSNISHMVNVYSAGTSLNEYYEYKDPLLFNGHKLVIRNQLYAMDNKYVWGTVLMGCPSSNCDCDLHPDLIDTVLHDGLNYNQYPTGSYTNNTSDINSTNSQNNTPSNVCNEDVYFQNTGIKKFGKTITIEGTSSFLNIFNELIIEPCGNYARIRKGRARIKLDYGDGTSSIWHTNYYTPFSHVYSKCGLYTISIITEVSDYVTISENFFKWFVNSKKWEDQHIKTYELSITDFTPMINLILSD